MDVKHQDLLAFRAEYEPLALEVALVGRREAGTRDETRRLPVRTRTI